MQSDLERTLYGSEYISFTPDVSLMTASSTVNAVFFAPFNGYITELLYGCGAITGTTNGVTALSLQRGSTSLASCAANAVNNTVTSSGNVSVVMSAGEVLNIKVTLGHTDNAITGFTIQVRMRHTLATE